MAIRKKIKTASKQTIVIIGAALAGPTAAARAREINENAEIILLERNTRVSYAMSGLALHLSGEVSSLDDLNTEREDFFQKVYNIDVRTETEVEEIDAKKKCVHMKKHGKTAVINYDKLIFAAGAASLQPVGAKEAENFRFFRTLDDLAAIKASLAAAPAPAGAEQRPGASAKKRFVVLGGGSMGAEALDGLVRGGAEVTLIEKKFQFLPDYSPEIAAIAAAETGKKAKIIAGVKQLDFPMQGKLITAVIADGKRIETDFVVSAIGVRPRTELLKKAGVKLKADGSILIDRECRTNVKDIFACSICVSIPDGKDSYWIPQAAVSDKTAQVAGENAAGGKARLEFTTASQLIRLPGTEIGRTGLTWEQAIRKYGKAKIDRVFIHARDKEPYMPDSAPLALQVIYLKKKQQLIALEAVGQNIKSRLDAFSAALAGSLTLKDLAMLDFAYTPAFGTARDGLNAVATVALQKESGITNIVTYAEIKAQRKKFFVLDVSAKPTHAGFHDLHIALENLRANLDNLGSKLKAAKAKQIACLSETGRRGHLALRILKNAGFKAVNISGGKKQA